MSLIPFMDLSSGDFVTVDVGEKKNQKIKIVGTYENPYFCGRDVCEILEYKDIKQSLREHVKEKHKKELRMLSNELGVVSTPNSLGLNNLKNLTYHSGKRVKEFTGWTTSKGELTNGDLNYKIV
ncbi:MAG: BRO-N domain-containing protein [Cetobacterium sp.]